jgi:hypothetical protein
MAIDTRFTKAVDSYMALQTESNNAKTLYSGLSGGTLVKDLLFTLCDRTDASSKYGNYFSSFNLPTTASKFTTGSTLSKLFPELQQLNVDKIVVCPIPSSYYSEIIDGRTVKFYVPQIGDASHDSQTTMSAITLISSTYTSEKIVKAERSVLLGENIAFLFSDAINTPYTGYTQYSLNGNNHATTPVTGLGNVANTTWEPSVYYNDRPSAVSYLEVDWTTLYNVQYNTDQRTNAKYSVPVEANYPKGRAGYNYDIPVGFVVLDKGFIVITHTAVTENIPWTSGYTISNDAAYTTGDKTNIYFTGTTTGSASEAALMTFEEIDTSFKMSTVCLAMPRQFYISNNPSWDRSKVTTEQQEQTGYINYDSVYVTEIGLYNAFGELIAVAKLSEPVEKNYTNVITFNVNIEM